MMSFYNKLLAKLSNDNFKIDSLTQLRKDMFLHCSHQLSYFQNKQLLMEN